jgi:phosphatidylserine/phosphatidylglycerophosphate/cardiolipin synthase-like enzyme
VNVGLRGRVVDEEGRPLAGLVVDAWDEDVFLDDPLGATRTDADGRFSLSYSPDAYRGLVDTRPDIVVRVRDRAGIRTLAQSGTFRQARDPVLDVGEMVVARREAEGWRATGGTARDRHVSHGNHLEFFVDGQDAFAAALDAVERARREVWLMQLLFEPEFAAAFPGEDAARGRRFTDALRDACARGVDVRILLNENAVIPDHADEIEEAFHGACSEAHPVRVRRFPMTPAVMHAKMLVRDGEEALVIGPPFEQRFWDSSAHRFDEPRRGEGMPVHDVCARMRGPAVTDVARVFTDLWNVRAPDGDRLLLPPRAAPVGDLTLQVNVTAPGGLWRPGGELSILESYERALAHAESFAYLETQYFTSEAVTRAIRRALDANPRLEVILLLNESMDIPLYNQWQRARLAELGHPRHPRFRAYSPWQVGLRDGKPAARTVYVHSKAAVIDDRWATVGSANLDGISMEGAREVGLRGARSVDVNVGILDGVDGSPATGHAARLRVRLWSEMLGLPPAALRERPEGGWLELWDDAARRNLDALHRDGALDAGFVLPHGATLPQHVRVLERGMAPFTL